MEKDVERYSIAQERAGEMLAAHLCLSALPK